MPAIEVTGLTKRYGTARAVSNLSFSVNEGEVVGFLGPNGAGKSTTMNILTGYLSASAGRVRIGGYDILERPRAAKALIGYLPEQPPLYLDMTAWEYLCFVLRLKRLDKKGAGSEHILDVSERTGIGDVLGRKLGNLSKGYRQRVGLAQALLGEPPVLILDEPTVGLDPRQIIEIRDLIRELGKKHTVILSSHILTEVQAVCPRILIIGGGILLADGAPDALPGSLAGENRLIARIEGPAEMVAALLRGLDGVESVEAADGDGGSANWTITHKQGADVRRALFFALAKRGWPLLSLHGGKRTLEEIFLTLTANAAATADADEAGSADADEAGPADADEAGPASDRDGDTTD